MVGNPVHRVLEAILPFHHIKLSDSEAILARHCFNVLLKTFKA
jgi:hypothetical protein